MSNALKNAVFVLLCLAGLWVAARGLVATSTAESLATLIVAAIVLPIIGAFGTALLIMATIDRTRPRYEPPPAIQTDYSVLPAWQRPQLAAPRVVHAGRFIDNGELPAYRFGRVIRLKESEVDRFIESCRIEPGSLEHLYPEAGPAVAVAGDEGDEAG